ncbi:hypothetical protein [Algoriphagus formosus]|uniref:hypothetical protein n=1 Tax=Algoriphagus formosus TaxID=2007308 RepID=UPI003F7036E4
MEKALDWVIGIGLIAVGIILLIILLDRPEKPSGEFGKAARLESFTLAIGLILWGILYLSMI